MGVIEEILRIKDEASAALKGTGKQAESLNKRLGTTIKAAGSVSAGLLALGGAAAAASQHVADLVNDLGDMATRTGISVETLNGLKVAAEGSGLALENLEEGLRGYNMRLISARQGSKTAEEAFTALGVSLVDNEGQLRSNEAVLRDTIAALQDVKDPSERALRGVAALGEGAGKLMQAVGDNSLETFVERARYFGTDVGPDAAQAASDWQRAMADLGMVTDAFATSWSGLLNGVGSGLVDDFTTGIIGASTYLAEFMNSTLEQLRITFQHIRDDWKALQRLLTGKWSFKEYSADMLSRGNVRGMSWGTVRDDAAAASSKAVAAYEATRPSGGRGGSGLGAPVVPAVAPEGAGGGGGGAQGPQFLDAAPSGWLGGSQVDTASAWEDAQAAAKDASQAMVDAQNRVEDAARSAANAAASIWVGAFDEILNAVEAFGGKSLALEKAVGIAKVAVSTIVGAMRAMELGPVAGPIAAAGVTAIGIAQAAALMAVQKGTGPGPFRGGGQSSQVDTSAARGSSVLMQERGTAGGTRERRTRRSDVGSTASLLEALDERASGGLVARTGVAVIHRGERIISPNGAPSQVERNAMQGGGGGFTVTVREVDRHGALVELVRQLNELLGPDGYGFALEGR